MISNGSAKTFLAKLLIATNNMKFETAADLLTWKNMEVEDDAMEKPQSFILITNINKKY